ncbi:ribonuclease III domain-containing protein [Polychytrium aggregatum]|uniref:ribonuclease III domain-containing protein n=1 Tax=Polychytrium aggregatum TaxID=110093 RepID=UPI0022FE97AB|nr:ribonuclease III domain-containing protein [Polychytrium aggregatum]KAI9209748.1 ribonuclease III domain-containing protein [Polychytrium aggregatum]
MSIRSSRLLSLVSRATSLRASPNGLCPLAQRAFSTPVEAEAEAPVGASQSAAQSIQSPLLKEREHAAKLAAFQERTGLVFSSTAVLDDALTHRSYKEGASPASGRYQVLGAKVIDLFVSEYVYAKYPSLPADALESVAESYSGTAALATVGGLFGISNVMRWKANDEKTVSRHVVARVFQGLVGALYVEKGPKVTREFIQAHLLSRKINVEAHLKLVYPKTVLANILREKNKPPAVARLLKETGRQSASPVFVVGVYSGLEKLGEGFGSSLDMAEFRAARDALQKNFLVEVESANLPSAIDEDGISFFEKSA